MTGSIARVQASQWLEKRRSPRAGVLDKIIMHAGRYARGHSTPGYKTPKLGQVGSPLFHQTLRPPCTGCIAVVITPVLLAGCML